MSEEFDTTVEAVPEAPPPPPGDHQPPTFPIGLAIGNTKVILHANGAAEVDVAAFEQALTSVRGPATLETIALWTLLRILKTTVRA